MLTREEKIAELTRRAKIAELQRRATEEPQSDYEPGWRERATALTQGATWNTGDEITSAIAATFGGVGEGWTDRYKDILQSENQRQDEYIAERPKEALGLELAGGLITRRPRAKAGLDKMLGRTARVAEKKAIALAEQTGAQKVRANILKNVGSGIAEGAVVGAASREEDRWGGALTGAGLGAALPLALSGSRQVARTIGRRRIKEPLGKGKNFKGITLAADKKENWASDMYRDFQGRAVVTKNIMAKQEARFLQNMERETLGVERAVDDAVDVVAKRGDDVGVLKKALKSKSEEEAFNVRGRADARQIDIDARLNSQIDEIDQNAILSKEKLSRASREVGERGEAKFRGQAAERSLPDHAVDARASLVGKNPQKQAEIIDNWWSGEGFSQVKQTDFKWDGGDLFPLLDDLVRESPAMALELGNIAGKIPGMAQRMQSAATKGSRGMASPDYARELADAFANPDFINGDALMAMRNVFARAANSSSGFRSKAMSNVKRRFDTTIRRGLNEVDPKLVDQFDDELAKYGASRVFGDAVLSARGNEGLFTSKDWLRLSKGGKAKYGKAALQKEAGATRKAGVRATEQASKAKSDVSQATASGRKSANRQSRKLKKTVQLEKTRELRKLKKLTESDEGVAKATRELADAKKEKKILSRALRKQKRRRAELKGRELPSSVPVHQQIAATAATLGPIGVLSTAPGVQRAVAGQAAWQEVGQEINATLLKQKKIGALIDRLRSSLVREISSEEDN